jgi:hypothetical protein
VQLQLLDRFAELGTTVRLVMEWPTYDDDEPLYVNAEKSKVVPLTINQRLELVGRDPLDPAVYGDLGSAIYMDQSMVPLFDPTGGAGGSVPTPPSGTPPTTASPDEVDVVKASPMGNLRQATEVKWEPRLRRAVASVLAQQQAMAVEKVPHTLRKNDTSWWDAKREDRRMMDALAPLLKEMATDVATATRHRVKSPKKADEFIDTVLDDITKTTAARVTAINEHTRSELQRVIRLGVEAKEGPVPIAKRIQEATAFNELRAETVSRTETMFVYNDAALGSYRQLGVQEVEAIDGDADPECAARNGLVLPIGEARGITDHPNGTLDWIPVV